VRRFIFDELTGMPTILATERAKRKDQTGGVEGKTDKKVVQKDTCFFCKGSEHLTPPTVYQDQEDWNVRVFANKFPLTNNHEIVVHSPDHELDFTELPHAQNIRIIRAFLNRVNHYTSDDFEVMIFNNRGGKAGASLLHPHSQIVALKGFPGIVEDEKHSALRYYDEHNSCYWCDLIKTELTLKTRIIYESAKFVLLVPRASRWSYEMMLMPKAHNANFEYIDEQEINDFAKILRAALYAYDKAFDKPDRNFWIHSQRFDPYHWHMGFIPHIKVFGGLELGAGIWVSDKATPEDAAARLGKHVKDCYEGLTSIASDES
jgi:UDPglucose--hexose-1-phosphate uridylyltransferase